MKRINRLLVIIMLTFVFLSCGGSLYDKAVNYYETGRYQQGIEFFKNELGNDEEKALSLFPVHRYVLQYYQALGKLDEGVALYAKFKNKALANYIKGVVYLLQTKDYTKGIIEANTKALALFRKALVSQPKQFILYYEIGLALAKLRRFGRAAVAFAKAIQENDGFAPAYYDLGLLYGFGKARYGVGKAYIKEALGNFTPSAKREKLDARFSLGKMYELMGKKSSAISIYEDLAQKDFMKLALFADLGTLYKKDGDPDKAVSFWKRAIALLGYYSAKGRYYFKQLAAHRRGGLDLTDVGYRFMDEESGTRLVLAEEGEFFFMNPKRNSGAHRFLRKRGLLDLRLGYEYWRVEYNRVGTKSVPIRKWIQSRGIIQQLKMGKGQLLLVSVKRRVSSLQRKVIGKRTKPASEKKLWRKSDCKIGYISGGRLVQTLSFPTKHLYKVALLDIDNNGSKELVVSGFNAAKQLVVVVFVLRGGRWKQRARISCDLLNKRNGFFFADLDGKRGLELVKFSGPISWPTVYSLRGGKFRKNDSLLKPFARSFINKFGFFTKDYVRRAARRSSLSKRIIRLYGHYTHYVQLSRRLMRSR